MCTLSKVTETLSKVDKVDNLVSDLEDKYYLY